MCNHKRYLHNIKSLHIKEIETWTKVAILRLNACKHTWSPISTYQGKVCSLHKFVELWNLFLQLFPIQCGITRLWWQLFIWNRSWPITWICLVLFLERGNIMHNYVTKGINFIAFRWALCRSPEEKGKVHSGAIYRGPLMLSTKYW